MIACIKEYIYCILAWKTESGGTEKENGNLVQASNQSNLNPRNAVAYSGRVTGGSPPPWRIFLNSVPAQEFEGERKRGKRRGNGQKRGKMIKNFQFFYISITWGRPGRLNSFNAVTFFASSEKGIQKNLARGKEEGNGETYFPNYEYF